MITLMGYFLIGLVFAILLNHYLILVIKQYLGRYLVERWPTSGTPRTSHVTALVSDGAVEPGISELVTTLAEIGLVPERACAGHGRNDEGNPELPYVYFYAYDQKLAYQLYRVCIAAQLEGHHWTLFALFPGSMGMKMEIPERQPTDFRYRLELLKPRKHRNQNEIQEAIHFLMRLIQVSRKPNWPDSKLVELGFPATA